MEERKKRPYIKREFVVKDIRCKRKKAYLENMMDRDFYNFYRKIRRKPSRVINQYNYFEKAINGMLIELRRMMDETEYGVHLKGLGVLYKKPFGEYYKQLSIFTHRKVKRKNTNFYLEDDYLRRQYLVINLYNPPTSDKEVHEDKATAIILHRKLNIKK